MKPEVPRMRRFFFCLQKSSAADDALPAGFAALLLHLVKNMIYCICNLHLAI